MLIVRIFSTAGDLKNNLKSCSSPACHVWLGCSRTMMYHRMLFSTTVFMLIHKSFLTSMEEIQIRSKYISYSPIQGCYSNIFHTLLDTDVWFDIYVLFIFIKIEINNSWPIFISTTKECFFFIFCSPISFALWRLFSYENDRV